jgi:hypothetical protein
MSVKMERAKDFEILGARITKNRVLDRKIWAFEALWAKWSFQEILGAYLEFLEWLEGLGVKDRGLCKIWELFKGFCEILECFGPICN